MSLTIAKLSEIISIYGGYFYGNIVKDFLVPKFVINHTDEISFDQVDILLDPRFNDDVMKLINIHFSCDIDIVNNNKCKILSMLDSNGLFLFNINLIAMDVFSDKKFDVYNFTFDHHDMKTNKQDNKFLIEKIKYKQTMMKKDYVLIDLYEFNKINDDFFLKGWTVSTKTKQVNLMKWSFDNNICILQDYSDGYWRYFSPISSNMNKIVNNSSEYKIEIAKQILSIANTQKGRVYGGFVRDVVIPRIHIPNCKVSFKDIDIWFKTSNDSKAFVNALELALNIQKHSFLDRSLDYPDSFKFTREQYRVYSPDGSEFLFHIDVITSHKLPVDDFNVNTITYKYEKNNFYNCKHEAIELFIINKIACMLENYNIKGGYKHFERINRIFFKKGWIVRCTKKNEMLSDFIKKENLNIKEINYSFYYDYVPQNHSQFDPDTANRIKSIPFLPDFIDKNDNLPRIPKLTDEMKSDKDFMNRLRKIPLVTFKDDKVKDDKVKDDKVKDDKAKDDKAKDDKVKDDKAKDDKAKDDKVKDDKVKDDKVKDVMMEIFNLGLQSLNEKISNNNTNKEIQYIYDCGLDEYRNKFNELLKQI